MTAPPDGGWGWAVVLAVSVVHLLEAGAVRAVGVFYVEFLERFEGSATSTAWVCAIASLLWSGLGPIVSSMTEYFGARAVTMAGGIIMFIGYLGAAFSKNLYSLSFTFGVTLGIGLALCYAPGYIIVGEYFNKRKGLAMSLATVGGGLGNFIFPPVIGALFQTYGYLGTMSLLAALSLHVVAFAALYRPLKPTTFGKYFKKKSNKEKNIAIACTGIEKQIVIKDIGHEKFQDNGDLEVRKSLNNEIDEKSSKVEEKEKPNTNKCYWLRYTCEPTLWRNPPILLFLLLTFNVMNVFMSTANFMPSLAMDMGIGSKKATFLLSIVGISDCIARVPFGFLYDWKPIKKVRSIVYICMISVVGIGCFCMPLANSYGALVFLACIRGSLSGTFMAQRATILHDYVGKELVSQAFGLLLFSTCLGSLVARLVGGALKDGLGTYDLAFYTSSTGLLFSAGLFLIYELYSRRKRSSP